MPQSRDGAPARPARYGWTLQTIFIALPAFGQVCTTHTTASLMALSKHLRPPEYDFHFSDFSFPFIDDSRNLLATFWFDNTADDWLLQIDADMRFNPQLVLDMLGSGHLLTGCLYPKKTYPLQFVGTWGQRSKAGIENGFMEVDGIGGGVMLAHRSVLQAMLDKGVAEIDTRDQATLKDFGLKRIIRAFDRIDTEGGRLAEDFSFCHRHQQCGGDVWASINHRVIHVGQHGYAGRYADQIGSVRAAGAIETNSLQPLPAVQFHRNGKNGGDQLLGAQAL